MNLFMELRNKRKNNREIKMYVVPVIALNEFSS